MLKPRLSVENSQSGQAMIELIPALLIFFILILMCIVFFQGIRESSEMQEAARNAAFTKIANSGPLVSAGGSLVVPGEYVFPNLTGNSPAISEANVCFTATPENGTTQAFLPSLMGVGMNLSRAHKATVFRQPAGGPYCE